MTKQMVTYLKYCYFHRKWQLACYVIILSVKSLEDGIPQHLTLIFAKSFKTRQLSHNWHMALAASVLKGISSDGNNYRPMYL